MLATSSLVRFLAGAAIGIAALFYFYAGPVDPGTIALGTQTVEANESVDGLSITASRVGKLRSLVRELRARPVPGRPVVLWLGNSQMHAINQYRPGDHLATYWLVNDVSCALCLLPIGATIPNADIQEHYVLASYFISQIKTDLVVLELCFDDLREDGLRDEFELVMDDNTRKHLDRSVVGKQILTAWDARAKVNPDAEEVAGLQGFVQRPVEKALVSGLGALFPLWRARPYLRAELLDDLYWFRNWVFRIKPSTVRRMIAVRYERNMRALETLMEGVARDRIPMIAYIAPIRNDVSIPYEPAVYARWKDEVAALAARHGVTLLNLEALVPGNLWGSYHNDDIDFMHFQGPGHQLVANALRPDVMRLLAARGR